jgi:hypothetical protein
MGTIDCIFDSIFQVSVVRMIRKHSRGIISFDIRPFIAAFPRCTPDNHKIGHDLPEDLLPARKIECIRCVSALTFKRNIKAQPCVAAPLYAPVCPEGTSGACDVQITAKERDQNNYENRNKNQSAATANARPALRKATEIQ